MRGDRESAEREDEEEEDQANKGLIRMRWVGKMRRMRMKG